MTGEDDLGHSDIEAALATRRELGARYDAELVEGFAERGFRSLESRSLLHAPRRTLEQITDFLGVARHEWSAYRLQKVNAYPYCEELSPALAEELREFFRPHNQRLYQLLGVDFGWD